MFKEYYTLHSYCSNPGSYKGLFNCISQDISEICKTGHGLFLHYADLNLFSTSVSEERYKELNLRTIQNSLEKIILNENRALNMPRTAEKSVMGVCRDTALLLCSILRSRGIPTRLRSGFVSYFIPGLFLDGFCVEYYNEKKSQWCSVDTRTMQLHIDHYKLSIDFDLTDVPSDKFISAAQAWKMCRFENADPVRFGSRQHRGLFAVRNRLIQDLALLNKQETLIWDVWGAMLCSVITDFKLLDDLAELLINDKGNVKKITEFYNNNSLFKVPNKVLVDNPFLTAEWVSIVNT